ncbi:hypothetical protein [Idiomarina sp. UBA1919]|uniref:hypothetical protein n=1 Tax=Idiomarina sp. UBA1919 TaxID=1946640 RepID=UPI00257F09FE|nr:hypothetical protein [Idiomarina sp. UBA1919]|tara:strand:- start:718 stop:1218 length:501 start_codon:yes stop_codon:yes gene_type:complete
MKKILLALAVAVVAFWVASSYVQKAESKAFQKISYKMESIISAAAAHRLDTGDWPHTLDDLTTGEKKRLFLSIANQAYRITSSGDKFTVHFKADSTGAAKAIQSFIGGESSIDKDKVSISINIPGKSYYPEWFLSHPTVTCRECIAELEKLSTDIEVVNDGAKEAK